MCSYICGFLITLICAGAWYYTSNFACTVTDVPSCTEILTYLTDVASVNDICTGPCVYSFSVFEVFSAQLICPWSQSSMGYYGYALTAWLVVVLIAKAGTGKSQLQTISGLAMLVGVIATIFAIYAYSQLSSNECGFGIGDAAAGLLTFGSSSDYFEGAIGITALIGIGMFAFGASLMTEYKKQVKQEKEKKDAYNLSLAYLQNPGGMGMMQNPGRMGMMQNPGGMGMMQNQGGTGMMQNPSGTGMMTL